MCPVLYYSDDVVDLYHGDFMSFTWTRPEFSLILTDPPYDFSADKKNAVHAKLTERSRQIIVFSPPENQWILPADQYGFWVKPISTKNTSKRYSRFVEMLFMYGVRFQDAKRHWSQYTNVFHDLVEGESDHPFEKPRSLISRLIFNHTKAGDVIFDPFCGSGTTLVCAKTMGRKAIGIDASKTACDMAVERLESTSVPPSICEEKHEAEKQVQENAGIVQGNDSVL